MRFALILAICLAAPLTRAEPAATIALNTDDLSGWRRVGEADWRAVDGVIEARGSGEGFLVTAERYGDYTLTLEFWVDETTNSGVFIGCPDQVAISPMVCYEINIWDRHPKSAARTGAIVMEVMPPLAHIDTIGKWNRYEISRSGSSITVTLNGSVTAAMSDARPGAGYIALQHANNGTVRFRDIRLTLPASATVPTK